MLWVIPFLSCISYSSGIARPREDFPPYRSCGTDILISDPPADYEINELHDLKDMGYSTTYHHIIFPADTLEKEEIRRFTSKLSKYIVKDVLPEVSEVSDDKFRSMSYLEYYQATKRLYPTYLPNRSSPTAIENILVPSPYRKQLFMNLRTYIQNKDEYSNYLHVYVFDARKKRILYYDFLRYTCDIRDSVSFSLFMNYSLNKLKTTVSDR
ncbi:hypothetical protein [Muriicola jejuensis]|uniref:Uncharacterized protein n=1 Tax=Muriicola jejuensis TaxID=504488 RepID=A0A6P0UFU2_9FLAO|nr:hypothetical protein [Muriicola jejuensis]NER08976.1 hypothetical protein [Muriicola jejuensis]